MRGPRTKCSAIGAKRRATERAETTPHPPFGHLLPQGEKATTEGSLPTQQQCQELELAQVERRPQFVGRTGWVPGLLRAAAKAEFAWEEHFVSSGVVAPAPSIAALLLTAQEQRQQFEAGDVAERHLVVSSLPRRKRFVDRGVPASSAGEFE